MASVKEKEDTLWLMKSMSSEKNAKIMERSSSITLLSIRRPVSSYSTKMDQPSLT